jgi:hypothetical protein
VEGPSRARRVAEWDAEAQVRAARARQSPQWPAGSPEGLARSAARRRAPRAGLPLPARSSPRWPPPARWRRSSPASEQMDVETSWRRFLSMASWPVEARASRDIFGSPLLQKRCQNSADHPLIADVVAPSPARHHPRAQTAIPTRQAVWYACAIASRSVQRGR